VDSTEPLRRLGIMSHKPPAPSEPADYRRWRSRAAAMLERQGIPLGVARDRDLRQMYISGATPEQAAERVRVQYDNTRLTLERIHGKKS
jgi:hypothetical protein